MLENTLKQVLQGADEGTEAVLCGEEGVEGRAHCSLQTPDRRL